MSPSLQTMGFFMSDINFCNTKEQLNHLGEVVTGKVDGSPSGADIDTSTLTYTGQVRKTLPALEGEYEQSITDKEAEADAAIDEYRLLNKGPYASGIKLESKFEYITYNGESYFATNPPYTTTATTPDADGNLFLGGYTTFENVANKIGNKNELSNSNFLIQSPDNITHPNATPESYVAGTQIFSGVYAGDSGCTVTFIDGRVNCTAGDYRFKLPNTGGLERIPVFTSSVSDYDGIPSTTGVSASYFGDYYLVTVTPAAGDVFSVKFEQGDIATKHEIQSFKGQVYTFNTITEVITGGAPVGSKVQWLGYYVASDGGSNWGIVKSGVHVEDGGSIFSIDSNTYIEANVTRRMNVKKFGAQVDQDVSLIMGKMRDQGSISEISITENYNINNQFSYSDNLFIKMSDNALLTVDESVKVAAITANNKSNVGYKTLRMKGAGKPFTDGNERLCSFVDCDNLKGRGFYGEDSTNHGLVIDGCTNFSISKTRTDKVYGIGLSLRYGCKDGNVSGLIATNSGYTSDGSVGPAGRGYLIWQCENVTHSGFVIRKSSEYGCRVYSQTGDTLDCKNHTFDGLIITDSADIDLYIFNESDRVSDISFSQVNIQTTGTGKVAMALQGSDITVSAPTLKSLTAQQNTAISFNRGSRIQVNGGTAKNFGSLTSFGTTNPAGGCSVNGMDCSGLIEVLGANTGDDIGNNHKFRKNKFKFDASTTITALTLTDANNTELDGNEFDSAYRCVTMNNSPSKITANKSKNTIDVPIRKFGSSLSGLELRDNSWDKDCNPRDIGYIDRLSIGTNTTRVTGYSPVNPSTFTNVPESEKIDYPVRSIFYSTDQGLLPGYIGWVKTAAGVPGSWTPFGAL